MTMVIFYHKTPAGLRFLPLSILQCPNTVLSDKKSMKKLFLNIQRFAVILLAVVFFFYAVIEARTLLYPVVMSVLFAFLLFPFARFFEERGVARIASIFIVVFVASGFVIALSYVLYSQIGFLIRELPELKAHARDNIAQITEPLSSNIGVTPEQFRGWMNEQINVFFAEEGIFFTTIFPSTTGTLIGVALMPSYIFLFLYYRDKFYNFIMMVSPGAKKEKIATVIREITNVTRRYMNGVVIVVGILIILNTIGLLYIGVKFALLLGILWGLCNFIPYFGVLIGAVLPLAMAIFTGETSQEAVSVFILFLVIQFIENYILTPNITGGGVQVNPLVTIISIITGGLVWGLPGMFVIIPIVGMMKIVFANSETTQPIAYLMGTNGTEEHAITLSKFRSFFNLIAYKRKK
jgi:predicted PurR-regulated permease PerM